MLLMMHIPALTDISSNHSMHVRLTISPRWKAAVVPNFCCCYRHQHEHTLVHWLVCDGPSVLGITSWLPAKLCTPAKAEALSGAIKSCDSVLYSLMHAFVHSLTHSFLHASIHSLINLPLLDSQGHESQAHCVVSMQPAVRKQSGRPLTPSARGALQIWSSWP